ncbi:MAG: AAA domain-containing protein [Candidatus Geothermincolia bacterium]
MADIPLEDLRERLLLFIEKERAATWRNAFELHNLTIEERVDEGLCIAGLEYKKSEDRELIFRVKENSSKFRPGEPVFLGDGIDIMAGRPAIFRKYDPITRLLRIEPWGRPELPQDGPQGYVVDARVWDTSDRRANAVDTMLGDPPNGFARACDVAQLKAAPTDNGTGKVSRKMAKALGLNKSQVEAFAAACSSPLALIQGPPGTGKTFLLAHLIGTLAEGGMRILVCCFTHRAVNNVLNAVIRETSFRNVFKVSSEYYVDDLEDDIEWRRDPRRLCLPRHGGYVVGSTPYAAWRMNGMSDFDMVLFDEAGQLTIDLALMGMSCADRYVFVGDHQQLSPVLTANHADPLVRRSIFEHLVAVYPSVMLDTTYRMNTGIAQFPSQQFYGGLLQSDALAQSRELALKKKTKFADILDPANHVVFVRLDHEGMQMVSTDEARLIAEVVVELVKAHKVKPSEIAVVAPFRAQVREIQNRIAEEAKQVGIEVSEMLVVDTVERIQGQERDVIVVSFTSSDEQYLRNKIDFYFNPNRLNVAITRPRLKLIMIGSKHAFRVNDRTPSAVPLVIRGCYKF